MLKIELYGLPPSKAEIAETTAELKRYANFLQVYAILALSLHLIITFTVILPTLSNSVQNIMFLAVGLILLSYLLIVFEFLDLIAETSHAKLFFKPDLYIMLGIITVLHVIVAVTLLQVNLQFGSFVLIYFGISLFGYQLLISQYLKLRQNFMRLFSLSKFTHALPCAYASSIVLQAYFKRLDRDYLIQAEKDAITRLELEHQLLLNPGCQVVERAYDNVHRGIVS